jgi:Mrp family chromosome partitioning ATPase
MFGRVMIGAVAALAMLSVLAIPSRGGAPAKPATATKARSQQVLAPWRPSLATRFAGALTGLDQHVLDSHERAGYVTASVAGVGRSGLAKLRADAAKAALRVARTCRCDLNGYRVVIQVPMRAPVVLASGAL